MAEHRRKVRSARRGHSLIDVATATLVMGFIVTVFGGTFIPATRLVSHNKSLDLATHACTSELEARRTAGYNSIPSDEQTLILGTAQLLTSLPPELPNASAQLVIRRVAVTGDAPSLVCQQVVTDTGILQLEVTVRWGIADGNGDSVTISTLVTR